MLSARIRGEEMQAMLPMMMIKLYATKAGEKIANAAYDLCGGEGLLDIDDAEIEPESPNSRE